MAIRTIDAPGIEIREIDKSQYSPAMTGTKVLVTGFANSGEDYIPMIFTSKSAWLKYYGEPDNEAERYFYAASMEVLNQNGVVNCCKLPYENTSRDKFVAKKYNLGMEVGTINTVYAALQGDLSSLRDALPNSEDFTHDVIDYFMSKFNITDVTDKKTLQSAVSLDTLSDDVNTVDRSDDKTPREYTGNFFEVYAPGSEISDVTSLSVGFLKQMTKTQLLNYMDNLKNESVTPYMNACYAISDSYSNGGDTLTQNISVLIAYDGEANFAVLTAQNVVDMTDEELSDLQVRKINGLLSTEGIDIETISDDIYATFDLPYKTYDFDEDFQSLVVRKFSGVDAFQLFASEEMPDERYQSILNVIKTSSYKMQGYETLKDAVEYFQRVKQNTKALNDAKKKTVDNLLSWCEIKTADETVDKYLKITSTGTPYLLGIDEVDEYRTDESRVGTNEIVIVDKTRRTYTKIPEDKNHKGTDCELIGIIPVVTTAANALYAQSMIDVAKVDAVKYETILDVQTLNNAGVINTLASGSDETAAVISKRFNNDLTPSDNEDDFFESLAMEANGFFTPIALQADGGFDRENLKKIGLVVFQAYLDASEGNKISFQAVEAFVGSLDRDAKNPNTGATTFIDTIVNEQSEYVNIFTNCIPTAAMKNNFKDIDILVLPHDEADAASLGFYEDMCKEDIDVSDSILKALDIVYDKVTDINEREIDIVVDGGISNIAQFIKTVYGERGAFDPISPDAAMWKCAKDNDVKMWKTVIQKMDNFCKNIRKDCMFIADGPRPYCLQGQKKIVRPSKPKNTIDANILPYTKYLTGINTSYGAGYCDWFQVADEFSGDYFWCPPSIKACGVYIFTDLNFEYWDAPAGLNRGMVAALDVAFSPTNKQAGQIYTKSWNYAINYPQDGIILEGQRTLQSKPSALDRVNVRRLMLRLERAVYKVLRYVVYEGHTATLRQRVIDLIKPVFEQAKIGGGLYDYKLICDESINTPDVIDRNELKLKIGLKPTKTVEFIEATFTLLNTGASWSEM